MKDVVFVSGAAAAMRSFPTEARHRAGYQVYPAQTGADPDDWKPMTSIGAGCREIRIRTDSGAWRVIYVASIGDAVYVLHCFEKKTQKTTKQDIDLAKKRYRQAVSFAKGEQAP